MRRINLPLDINQTVSLKSGELVLLSGVIYTARDQAHKRIIEALKGDKKLPIDLKGQIIYYCGPTPAAKKRVIGTSTSLSTDGERPSTSLGTSPEFIEGRSRTIGSCGPTTSSRMDEFTPLLLRKGLKGMIGKGKRSKEVVRAIRKYKAVYFLTYAGCGALLSKYIKKAKRVAYKDLGPEAIFRLEVKDFPLIVAIDAKGNNVYD